MILNYNLKRCETLPRLEVKNLSRSFGKLCVVDGISFKINSGQVTCLLGPSGCGKSTSLRMIAGVEKPSSGQIFVDNELISDQHYQVPAEARSIGLMFQDFALFPHLNVKKNIEFGFTNNRYKQYDHFSSDELLKKVGLDGFQKKYPHTLSGGEQQRIALARAISGMPMLMLMDEPFSGLDKRLRDEIRDETIEMLRDQGVAVLIVTHEPEEAMKMADNIALMKNGKIIQQGAPYNIYNKPLNSSVAAFFSDINILNSIVKDGRTDTPFGPFITPGFKEGSYVEIIIRPQHLKIDFDRSGKGPNATVQDGVPARGKVCISRFIGKESIVELKMEKDGSKLKASIPGVFLPDPETPLWLSMRRDRCFVLLKNI